MGKAFYSLDTDHKGFLELQADILDKYDLYFPSDPLTSAQ